MYKNNLWQYFLYCLVLCLFITACGTASFADESDDEDLPVVLFDDDSDSDSDMEESPEVDEAEPTPVSNMTEPAPDADTGGEAWIAAYDQFVEDLISDQLIPGAAVAVIYQDEIIFAQGYGWRDVENQLPVTTETLFHIGSTNKSMTAMLVATLVDEGLFTWDTPVVEIYPDFALSGATETVTFHHLLSMSSGISADAEDDFDIDEGTAEDIFTYIETLDLLAPPGEAFSYSNISASLAGYLAVLAVEEDPESLYDSYAALLTEQVLRPIGMETAVVSVEEAKLNPNYGKSYWVESEEWVEAEPADFIGDPFAPSGIVKANVMEMALYMQTQLNQGVAPNGVQVVSAENMAVMWQPQLEGYALGWQVDTYKGVDVISHEGSFDSYLSVIGFVPELELGYVILTNSEDTGEALLVDAPPYLIDQLLQE